MIPPPPRPPELRQVNEGKMSLPVKIILFLAVISYPIAIVLMIIEKINNAYP